MPRTLTEWVLLVLVIGSALSLAIVYVSDYIPEYHLVKALPLAIVAGLSAIALAIHQKP